jgi:tRNA(Ile)-lysidine synthase
LQHYRIYRFRQHLYRLSRDFVDWLASATLEHRYNLSKSLIIDIRESRDTGYLWQLKLDWDKLDDNQYQELIDNKISLKITPLDRQRKVQTTTMGRAQAGKKLYQTLAIPVWLRSSLVVVSAVVTDTDISNENSADTKVEVPLLLLSPFQSWTLKSDLSSNNLADTLTLLSEACVNALQKVRKP